MQEQNLEEVCQQYPGMMLSALLRMYGHQAEGLQGILRNTDMS